MKRWLAALFAVLILIPVEAVNSTPPSPWIPCSDGDGYCLDSNYDGETDFRASASSVLSIGSPSAKGSNTETAIEARSFLNSASETVVGFLCSYLVVDNTDGSEDTAILFYRYESGKQCVAKYFGPALSAAPEWSPCVGCIAVADRANYDPALKGSGGAYVIWYDSDSWEAIDDQAN
jgi:hypothetical protein